MTLDQALLGHLGCGLSRLSPVSGGDINDAWRLILEDGRSVFMKSNRSASESFFRAEADGLMALGASGAIRVPCAIALGRDDRFGAFLLLEWVEASPKSPRYWEDFGRDLAALHAAPTLDRFGWDKDNYIGSSVQRNALRDRWIDFFRDCRLAPQFEAAKHYFSADGLRRFLRLLDHLDGYLIEPERPSLLHGDLWSGNAITGPDGRAWLIDPAVSAGHPEADLAMTELFGGFHPRFYDAYREASPLNPGYADRRDLYNLYHLLNHLNLFGGGYLTAVERIVRRYAG